MSRWPLSSPRPAGQSGADGTDGVTLRRATVTTVNPLGISINGAAITRNVYCNPAYTLEGYDTVDKLREVFADAPEPAALFDFLEAFSLGIYFASRRQRPHGADRQLVLPP